MISSAVDFLASSSFRAAAGEELLTALCQEEGVIYAVDPELTLHFLNPAWREHALANGGQRCVERYGLGSSLRDVIPAVLRRFYEDSFAAVFGGGAPLEHTFRCSSAIEDRSFRMRVSRLVDDSEGGTQKQFVVVANHLVNVRAPGSIDASPGDEWRYVQADGLVVQCAHCRRCRLPGAATAPAARWDWVPEYVARAPAAVSHGLCPSCFAQHYPF